MGKKLDIKGLGIKEGVISDHVTNEVYINSSAMYGVQSEMNSNYQDAMNSMLKIGKIVNNLKDNGATKSKKVKTKLEQIATNMKKGVKNDMETPCKELNTGLKIHVEKVQGFIEAIREFEENEDTQYINKVRTGDITTGSAADDALVNSIAQQYIGSATDSIIDAAFGENSGVSYANGVVTMGGVDYQIDSDGNLMPCISSTTYVVDSEAYSSENK